MIRQVLPLDGRRSCEAWLFDRSADHMASLVPERANGSGRYRMPRSASCAFAQFNMVAANRRRGRKLYCGPLALAIAFVGLCPAVSGQGPSTFGTIVEGKLIIGLPDKSQQVLERSDIAKLQHKAVKLKSPGSKPSTYSGVPLKELLEHAGASFKVDRKQANLGSIVVVESVDAPSTVFAMAEFDSALTSKQILLADSKDGKPLSAGEGPFRIIVPDEKEPVRWARQVWAIFIVQISGAPKQP